MKVLLINLFLYCNGRKVLVQYDDVGNGAKWWLLDTGDVQKQKKSHWPKKIYKNYGDYGKFIFFTLLHFCRGGKLNNMK